MFEFMRRKARQRKAEIVAHKLLGNERCPNCLEYKPLKEVRTSLGNAIYCDDCHRSKVTCR